MGTLKWVMAAALLVGCSGCSVVSGRVTDAESGAPIPDVRVGVLVLPPFAIEAEFQEQSRTDSDGQYRFAYGFEQPRIAFRLEDYLTATLDDTTDVSALDVALRSITEIKGTWDATITVDGGSIPATQFQFDEDGMRWTAEGISLGRVAYAFDGAAILIEGGLAHGDAIAGSLTASLALDETGGALSGNITFSHGLFDDSACGPTCTGTVQAVPAGT